MMTAAVTGGIGSGKTEVCHFLESRGIPVYDADSRTKALYDEDPSLVDAISRAMGRDVRGSDGRLDRRLLAGMVFSDAAKLSSLEEIVHPRVLDDFCGWKDSHADSKLVVIESAIILQKPAFRNLADIVILVDAPDETRIVRACKRDGADRKSIEARIASQKTDRHEADYIIENDSDIETLRSRVDGVLQQIRKNMKTNLARILSVSGQHGLYTYIAQARNGIIAEALSTGKRVALDAHSRVNTLEDISIYTSEGEMKLKEVFLALKDALGDSQAPTSKSSADELKALFAKAVPTYDEDRFYVSHMKKVIDWYNEIVTYASLDFLNEGEEEETPAEEAE